MKIDFLRSGRTPTGQVEAVFCFEMRPEEWDAFAREMQVAFDAGANGKVNFQKARRAILDLILTANPEVPPSPIKVVSDEEFARKYGHLTGFDAKKT